jgi:hypothetical protein
MASLNRPLRIARRHHVHCRGHRPKQRALGHFELSDVEIVAV